MDKKQLAIEKHKEWKGKIEVISRAKVTTPEELSIAYTPGVAEPCLLIAEDEDKAYDYTRKGNLVCRHHRRNRSSGTWRYRTVCWYAGYGRKVRTL